MFKRKKIIVFGYEGKNNKTETNYFKHFKPANDDFIIKHVSCGCTDPQNMLTSIKQKRKSYDYNTKEDKTFLFIDVDCKEEKMKQIERMKSKLPHDVSIILSSPTFELWFLNHFTYTTKLFHSNEELFNELSKHLPNYEKNKDYYEILIALHEQGIQNCKNQYLMNNYFCFCEVYKLFEHKILKNE